MSRKTSFYHFFKYLIHLFQYYFLLVVLLGNCPYLCFRLCFDCLYCKYYKENTARVCYKRKHLSQSRVGMQSEVDLLELTHGFAACGSSESMQLS